MFQGLNFEPMRLPESAVALREEVRDFLATAMPRDRLPNSDFGSAHDPEFSRKLGQRGWIGMTWPKAYGGHERTFFERYVVTEELLAAGAPVNSDGTLNLVHYAAWLVKEMTSGGGGGD